MSDETRFRMRHVTSEQRARAFEIAKHEVGVSMIPNDELTPMALFLMGAIADQCIGIAIKEDTAAPTAKPEVEGLA